MDRAAVEAAVSPERAVEAVRDAFIAHARGEWSMPPKVYVTNYPAGDFRAMPALGAGHALLKWITSFPGNPARGLPTVAGIVLVSDAATGELQAVLDAASVTALRTEQRPSSPPRRSAASTRDRGGDRRRRERPRRRRGRFSRADVPSHCGTSTRTRAAHVAASSAARVAGSREEALARRRARHRDARARSCTRRGRIASRPTRLTHGCGRAW